MALLSQAETDKLYGQHPGPYKLHRSTPYGVYHLMGDYETDAVHFAFRDCVASHSLDYVWVTDAQGLTIEAYDKDHDDHTEY